MHIVHLILFLCFFKNLTIVLTITPHTTEKTTIIKKPTEVNHSTKSHVLPYILQNRENGFNKNEKQYTLLASATLGTQPKTRVQYGNMKNDFIRKNSEIPLIDRTEETALPKNELLNELLNLPNIAHRFYNHGHDENGYNGLVDLIRHYYTGSTSSHASSHGTGIHIPALPVTLLLIINLSILSYVHLSVLGLLHKLLDIRSSSGHGSMSHNSYDKYGGNGQFGFLRKNTNKPNDDFQYNQNKL